jgi:hypothetical protein
MPYTQAIIPLRGWITDTVYSGVPEGFTQDIINMIPADSYRNRMRLGTRPGWNRMWQFTHSVQGMVRTNAFSGSSNPVAKDRVLIVANQGKIYFMEPGGNPQQVTRASDNATSAPLATTGPVEAVQRGQYAYFVDGTHYIKVNLFADPPKWSVWEHASHGPEDVVYNTVNAVKYTATKIALFGTRLVLGGVRQKENLWFMSDIQDPDHWSAGTGAGDPIAGNSGIWGAPGDEIVALIPFGRGGIVFAGKKSMAMLTQDPVFGEATIQQMSRTVGVVGQRAWTYGPEQSVYVMSQDGLYRLTPNDFNVDRGKALSANRLDSFFSSVKWDDIETTLIYDVERRGVWCYLTRTDQPESSTHLFYSEQTDGFFPFRMTDPLFRGAYSATQMLTADGRTQVALMGSSSGMLGFYDQKIISGIDGYAAAGYADNGVNPASVDDALAQRISSKITIGPIISPQPEMAMVKEVIVELGADEYLPDSAVKGNSPYPTATLISAETAQEAISDTVTGIRVSDVATITANGGTPSLAGDAQTVTYDGDVPSATHTKYLDGQYVVRAADTYTTQDTFVKPLDRVYEDTVSAYELVRDDVTIGASTTNRWMIRFQDTSRIVALQQLSNGAYADDPTVGKYYAVVTNGDYNTVAGSVIATLDGSAPRDLVEFQVSAAAFADQTLTALGNLKPGANNRMLCRVRTEAAYLRVEGQGYPFVMERLSINAESVGQRRKVINI